MRDTSASMFVAFIAAMALGFSFAGCNCIGVENPDAGCIDAGEVCSAGGAACCGEAQCVSDVCTTDGVTPPTDAGCIPSGGQCSSSFPCCSANCTDQNTCGAGVLCGSPGATCDENIDCCSGQCGTDGKCSEDRCLDVGTTCTTAGQCCSGVCNGTCQALSSACLALGSSCSETNDQCCSTNCRDGVCQRAYTCQALGDVCNDPSDCCSGKCSNGVCALITGGVGCLPEGTPCTSGNACCTNVCTDVGFGTAVCQPVSGCEVTGAICTDRLECCGGNAATGGTVQCTIKTGEYGKCDNGTACNSAGTICGKPLQVLPDGGVGCVRKSDGSCYTVPFTGNCCDDKGAACRMDEVNVPRCFGGQTINECPYGYTGVEPCCIQGGNVCEFNDECCGGALCLANDAGVRVCTVSQCLGLGTVCTPGATGSSACCAGSVCGAVDELTFACQLPTDAGHCDENGSGCSTAATCCSGICSSGTCGPPPPCRAENETCTVSGDCCTGLSCEGGVCRPGATCPAAGQVCSTTNPCCDEGNTLACTSNASGGPCDNTAACTCAYIFGKTQP